MPVSKEVKTNANLNNSPDSSSVQGERGAESVDETLEVSCCVHVA